MNTAMRVVKQLTFISLLAMVTALVTGAQTDDTLTIRATTRLVQLNIVVLDKNGKPVSGLTQNDFQVFDNGHEQRLVHFSASTVPTLPAVTSPLAVSNRPQRQNGNAGSMTVILVDEFIDQDPMAINLRNLIQSARLEILKFLGTLQPGDQVALYALRQEGVVVLHDFTDDSSVLTDAAKTLGSGLLRGTGSVPRNPGTLHINVSLLHQGGQGDSAQAIRGWLAGTARKSGDSYNDDVHRVLAGNAFQAIAQHLKGVPGRKNVVWISTTFPSMTAGLDPDLMAQERNTILPNPRGPSQPVFASPEGHYETMRGFSRYLSNTNVSVYPIDPQGLVEGLSLTGGGADRPTSDQSPPPPVAPTVGPLFIGPWSAMDLVASETGGRAFYDKNGLDHLLREIVDENRITYQLGYYPGDKAWDGKYHRVVVKLRREGLTLRCRKGYFATDQPMGTPDTALREAAHSPLDGAGIGLILNVSSNPVDVGLQEVVLKVETHDVHFENTNGRWRANLDVAFTELAADGRILGGIKDNLELALSPGDYAEATAQGWFYPKTFFVDPKAEKFRVVVRDLATGATGSVSVPVRHLAPPISKDKS